MVFLAELVGVAVVAWKVREDGENVVFEVVFLAIDKVVSSEGGTPRGRFPLWEGRLAPAVSCGGLEWAPLSLWRASGGKTTRGNLGKCNIGKSCFALPACGSCEWALIRHSGSPPRTC